MIIIGLFFQIPSLLLAQRRQTSAKPPPPLNCQKSTSPNERYQCFLKEDQKKPERVKKRKELDTAKEEKSKKQQQQQIKDEEARLKRDPLLQKKLEHSRHQNHSNRGKPYYVSFGRFVEPRTSE